IIEFDSLWKSGTLDVFSFGYVGNFPDPDGFIYGFKHDAIPNFKIGTQEFFKILSSIRHTPEGEGRLAKYESAIADFESSAWVVPMFNVSLPVIHKSDIKIPNISFQYEDKLCQIIAESKF